MGPALPVESQSWSRTPSRPLHMLTGRSERAHSAAVPKNQNSKVRRRLVRKERLNEQERPLTKESSGSKLCWARFGQRRQEDDSDWSFTVSLIKHSSKVMSAIVYDKQLYNTFINKHKNRGYSALSTLLKHSDCKRQIAWNSKEIGIIE